MIDHHHVALTNSGETFLGYAKQLLETYNKALAALWQDSDYAETTLNVAMFLGIVEIKLRKTGETIEVKTDEVENSVGILLKETDNPEEE